ncbi:MAG: arylsulfatase family protein [Planctomycetota bacterium]|nr:arylsulfatase family protein [Planctomycetota bacterium]
MGWRVLGWGWIVMAAGLSLARAEDRPPNIVLILADDLGCNDVGYNGRTSWKTPNLDRLAGQGMTARRGYAAAAVCCPSRAALLTGKSTIHCGVTKNNDDIPSGQTTIAEALKARGYATALFGKWHHGTPRVKGGSYVHPMDQGFDNFFGFTDATHAWEKFPTDLWEGRAKVAVTGHADDLFTDRGVAFIEANRARPFFLYLPLTSTHFNIEAPEEEVALHKGHFPEDKPERPIRATYAAMVTRLDRNVGRVLEALERAKLTNDTIVMFTSDHGATFETGNQGASVFHDSNAPFRGGKRTLWEGGLRVPFLVRWPNHVAAGSVSDQVQYSIDLFPTFLAASGAKDAPNDLDGVSLLPVWTKGEALPERTLFWEWRSEGGNQLAAMRGDEKLVITNGGKPELFDVKTDPAERQTLSALRPAKLKRLGEDLKAWLATEIQP